MSSSICVAATCRPIKGAHLDGCGSESCKGCMPRLAEAPLRVCERCRLATADHLAELGRPSLYVVTDPDTEQQSRRLEPSLYDALLRPTSAGPGQGRSLASERPPALGDNPLEVRKAISRHLRRWSYATGSAVITGPAGHGPEALMTRHILAHLDRLLSLPGAAELADDTDRIWRDAFRRAFPSLPIGHVIGTCPLDVVRDPGMNTERIEACGGQVRAVLDDTDEGGWASCRECEAGAVISWWREHLAAEHAEWMSMRDLRWHLSLMHEAAVPEGTIKWWAHAGKLETRPVGPLNEDGEAIRVEYNVAQAIELARNRRSYRARKAS